MIATKIPMKLLEKIDFHAELFGQFLHLLLLLGEFAIGLIVLLVVLSGTLQKATEFLDFLLSDKWHRNRWRWKRWNDVGPLPPPVMEMVVNHTDDAHA